MTVPVRPGADIVLGSPQPVIKGPYGSPFGARHYDVSSDGQRFLLLKDAPTTDGQKPGASQIHVVVNWTEELKRLVPTK